MPRQAKWTRPGPKFGIELQADRAFQEAPSRFWERFVHASRPTTTSQNASKNTLPFRAECFLMLCIRPAARPSPAKALQPLIQTANISAKEKKRKARLDPYWFAQYQARVAANQKRQAELKIKRDYEWGHPIDGILKPYTESFDSGGTAALSLPVADDKGNVLEEPHPLPTSPHILNFQVDKKDLDAVLNESYELTKPLPPQDGDHVKHEKDIAAHEALHAKASEALKRITAVENASSKERRHVNIRRIIEEFGRHNTDKTVPQRPVAANSPRIEPVQRAGPDTGSSEVQIAILTAKIRKLAQMYAGPKGNKDKANKRNLRLLLHRRQKLLRYMERKERRSGRWLHMCEKLGITPAMYHGEIEVR
ncbi:hypothetical protein PpBr36_07481 [Pyricularia pennisetigena]|uniref:hypothetical protein n=1 Tax=Pyricularia pennisetigena TaxID=1578925 RepID=UPI00114FB981|nr:hypothetical protein PpBr36_07481 [Pyricularia pennisetigena]TLS25477.1 hypothetical protein PpBr36_07481 [Pyricularia pennisetigena]